MKLSLRELGARLTETDYGDGAVVRGLLFDCPNPGCERLHSQLIPFTSAKAHHIPNPSGGYMGVWQCVSGTTVDDITLEPSFLVASCDGLHGYVRAGHWEPC